MFNIVAVDALGWPEAVAGLGIAFAAACLFTGEWPSFITINKETHNHYHTDGKKQDKK